MNPLTEELPQVSEFLSIVCIVSETTIYNVSLPTRATGSLGVRVLEALEEGAPMTVGTDLLACVHIGCHTGTDATHVSLRALSSYSLKLND